MTLEDAIRRIDIVHGKVNEFKNKDNESVLERLNRLMEPKEEVVDHDYELLWDTHHEDEMNRFFNEKK